MSAEHSWFVSIKFWNVAYKFFSTISCQTLAKVMLKDPIYIRTSTIIVTNDNDNDTQADNNNMSI